MSKVRTVYRCDVCRREYEPTTEDPKPTYAAIFISSTPIRSMSAGDRGACEKCIARLALMMAGVWDSWFSVDADK